MKHSIYATFTCLCLLLSSIMAHANNIAISNLSLTGKNTTDDFTLVQFDISWENSWRTSTAESNWDAAWVFVKYRVSGGAWQHAWLNNDGHTAPAGSTITPGLLTPAEAFNANTNPGLGAFVYRSADGAAGTFTKTGVQLRWNYGANSVSDEENVEIKVFAIEMVYVPQGAFTVGSGGTESGSFTNGSWTSGATVALSISSESAITIAQTAGNLWGTSSSGNNTLGGAGTLAAAFPKGYGAFYCMKYEISQQGYVDFLNSLSATQATARYASNSTYRFGITVSSGVYSTTNPYVACNFIRWPDVAAYLDWSGLRPMTELEYEKACRGTIAPVAGEYAWGSTSVTQNTGITNAGASNETSTNSGNCTFNNHASVQGPMRVGAFATASATRANAGSSYYGIMEMSGNLWERMITVGNTTGRGFTGTHGDGLLSASGIANVISWPDATGTGAGYRGGTWFQPSSMLAISDRTVASFTSGDGNGDHGGRGVRTQPPFICGVSSLTINHLTTGGVAPVDKTVTYGTVSTTLFGETKCAITRNLGASQQATAANDATEASAGWYWQFNRKQGYKMADDGITRTPVAWEAAYDNSSATWEAAKDPCTLELGTDWRIPTNTEWTSANALWNNYNDTYASVVKLHSAGYLQSSTASLILRGTDGYYWAINQSTATSSWHLSFTSSESGVYSGGWKSHGFSVRCIKNILPTVTTTAVTSIGTSTATSGGNVTDDGGSTITARGVCWSTTANPVATDSHATDAGTTGAYTSNITGLAAGMPYHVRAYATNSFGTAYGQDLTFSTACFIAGTKISMADGSVKNIEDVAVGDKVKSVNIETMEIISETVTKTYANPPTANLTKITFSNGQTNTNTKNHPYWEIDKGWSCVDPTMYGGAITLSAAPLAIGDHCRVFENGNLVTVTVTAIEDQPQLTVPTFNIEVNQTDCYFANGVLVHNYD